MRLAERNYLTVDGINVHYVRAGEGPVVLLLHGLGSSLVTWARNVGPLAEAGYHVLALDLPGHGDSDKPRDLSYDPMDGARLLSRFLQALGVARATVVGNSAGGLVVGLFALNYPELVDRLVLVAPGGLGKEIAWFLRILSIPGVGELLYQPRLYNLIDVPKKIFYREPTFFQDLLPEMLRVRRLPGTSHAALRSIRSSVNVFGLRKHRDILDRLGDLPSPLLTVWGEQDVVIPVSHADSVRRVAPRSVVRVMPECGHWPHMEKDEEFNDLLIRFLDGELDCGGASSAS